MQFLLHSVCSLCPLTDDVPYRRLQVVGSLPAVKGELRKSMFFLLCFLADGRLSSVSLEVV